MNILMITDVFHPRINGVSTSILTFATELRRQGHHVTLLAPDYGAPSGDETGIVRLPARVVWLDPEDRLFKRHSAKQVAARLGDARFDLIHIHTPFAAHRMGLRLAHHLGIPTVATYHTFFEEYLFHYLKFLPRNWLRRLARVVSRRQCNALDNVVVPSQAMRKRLTQYGVTTPMTLLPTGIDLNKLQGGDGARFRQSRGIALDRPVLVHIGRMAFEKNIGFLLEMLAEVRRAIPEVLLILAGEGPALAALKTQVRALGLEDNVHFEGYLRDRLELLDCYCSGDLFVFASRTETQGLVLLEAMAQGVPVVSTAVMGTCDIVLPGRGALAAPDQPHGFAEAVERLLREPALRKVMGEEGKRFAQEWSAEAMASRMAQLYGEVCAVRRREGVVELAQEQA
ncbi:MAG: glycosyl transferase family 1 [Alphaproteobacteria bacterium CG_4_10_14_0_2_um_filter_63_37]|nr:MAG: glycosyl transferase family 1 [Proteobacteria bacterium CG1_02_64_396]PJA25504.1 MAG: glycosyl transferase family 1 [Alphaproteobacteria bacterium CG_4_10_14_0_2_um_filter_63_37]